MTLALVVWIVLVVGPSGEGMTAIFPSETQCAEGRKELQRVRDVFISDCVSVPVQFAATET